jgi:hypothetical protein
MIDLQLQDTVQGADIVVNGKNVELSGGWQTMVYLALFGGNVGAVTAERAPEEIAEDWFANALLFDGEPAKQFNSRTQKALTSGAIGSNAEQVVKQAIEKDLAFVTSFANLEVEVNAKSFAELEVYIALQEKANLESKRFQFIWNNTEQELKGLTVEEPDTTEYEDFQFTGGVDFSARNVNEFVFSVQSEDTTGDDIVKDNTGIYQKSKIETVNVTSFEVRINGNLIASQFQLTSGDVLRIDFERTDYTKEAEIRFSP